MLGDRLKSLVVCYFNNRILKFYDIKILFFFCVCVCLRGVFLSNAELSSVDLVQAKEMNRSVGKASSCRFYFFPPGEYILYLFNLK